MTWALETIGTASKSKVASVLPAGSRASARCRSMRRRPRSADLVLGERGEEAGGRPALLVGLLGELGPDQLDARQAQLGEQQLDARGVDGVARRHAATSTAGGWLDGVDRRQFVVERSSGTSFDVDDRHRCRVRAEALPQRRQIGQSAGVEIGLDGLRQLGLAGRDRAPAPAARP